MIRDNVVAQLVAEANWSEETARLFERADHRCEYCSMDLLSSIDALKRLNVDHIIPRSKGGSAEFDNLAISCAHCNFHLKRAWDPRASAGAEADRSRLIEAIKIQLDCVRAKREYHLEQLRRIVGYGDA